MPPSDVPPTHPRYLSLLTRERIVAGVERGVTSLHGLIAHGWRDGRVLLAGDAAEDRDVGVAVPAAHVLGTDHATEIGRAHV